MSAGVGATIRPVDALPPEGMLAQVIPDTTMGQAVADANGVPDALTAGILAQCSADVECLAPRLDTGNVYLNPLLSG